MKRRASIPDEQIALEGLVSLSGHHTTTTGQQQHQEHHQSQSSRQRLPWNAMNHDDKPASENKCHHIPQVQVTFCPSTASSSSSSAPPSESKLMPRDGRPRRPSFSAKDALKDALAASEFGHAATATPYTSIHLPSTFFSTTSSAPTSPSFSLPPLSATLAACCSPSPSPRSSFSSGAPTASSAAATTSSSTTSAPASTTSQLRRASISGATMIHDTHPAPAKRIKLEHPSTFSSSSSTPSSSSASSSPMSSPRGSFSAPTPMTTTAAAAAAMMDDPPDDAQLIPVTARLAQGGDVCIHIEKPVLDALTASGISPESIVDLIVQNDKESRDQVIRETGFSTNYIMKLQRRVLHSSSQLQLPPPVRHAFGPGVDLHVLFDSSGGPLFMKKELCAILGMKGTTFSYWKKKSNVEDTDTSKDFRLMDICRTLFGGRATYTLYSPAATLTILNEMETSRQKNSFSNLAALKFLVSAYGHYGQRATRLLADPHHSAMALLLDSAADLAASPASSSSSSAASSPPSPPMNSTSTPTTATTTTTTTTTMPEPVSTSSAMDTTPSTSSSPSSSMYTSANLDGASAAADAVGAARSAAC